MAARNSEQGADESGRHAATTAAASAEPAPAASGVGPRPQVPADEIQTLHELENVTKDANITAIRAFLQSKQAVMEAREAADAAVEEVRRARERQRAAIQAEEALSLEVPALHKVSVYMDGLIKADMAVAFRLESVIELKDLFLTATKRATKLHKNVCSYALEYTAAGLDIKIRTLCDAHAKALKHATEVADNVTAVEQDVARAEAKVNSAKIYVVKLKGEAIAAEDKLIAAKEEVIAATDAYCAAMKAAASAKHLLITAIAGKGPAYVDVVAAMKKLNVCEERIREERERSGSNVAPALTGSN